MAQPSGGLGYSRQAVAHRPLWAGTRPQSQTMLFKVTQRWSKILWAVWRTFSTFSNYPLTQEGLPAFPTSTSRCRREKPPFQNHPLKARQQKRWWENIILPCIKTSSQIFLTRYWRPWKLLTVCSSPITILDFHGPHIFCPFGWQARI